MSRAFCLALVSLLGGIHAASGQGLTEVKAPVTPPPPALDAVAGSVNGQVIPEIAVYRALLRIPQPNWGAARKPIVNFLIENLLVEQYLTQLKIEVDEKDIAEAFKEIQTESEKKKTNLDDELKKMFLTKDDLRKEIIGSLRWEKFALQQTSDKNLKDFFDKNLNMFDGSQVQARHILVDAEGGNEQSKQKILALRQEIDKKAGDAIAALPGTLDKLALEKVKAEIVLKTFGDVAARESTCPSKKDGGDLGKFRRVGSMVEPFARAAFSLKPLQMSEPVPTEFGTHLILVTDTFPGREVKLEDAEVKQIVKGVYIEQLREAILAAYRPKSKIEINEKK